MGRSLVSLASFKGQKLTLLHLVKIIKANSFAKTNKMLTHSHFKKLGLEVELHICVTKLSELTMEHFYIRNVGNIIEKHFTVEIVQVHRLSQTWFRGFQGLKSTFAGLMFVAL